MQIVINSDGGVRCIYSDLLDLHTIGRLLIRRGSHVEPTAEGFWQVDLSPVKGPRLGPYRKRQEALEAETKWLEESWL
ncbi:MAG: hypothetical protein ACKO5E_04625 [bacterium]